MAGAVAARACVAGAGTSGAPSPAEGIGARPSPIDVGGGGGAAGRGAGATAAAGAPGLVSLLLRLPDTDDLPDYDFLPRSFPSGAKRPPLTFLVSARPVTSCASWRKVSAVR